MGTSADIGLLNDDGTYTITHVSGDGYWSGVGAILFKAYSTPAALAKLFAGRYIEDFTESPDDISHLDASEYNEPPIHLNADELSYLWRNGAWWARDWEDEDGPFLLLTRDLILRDAATYGDFQVNRINGYLDGEIA